MPLSRYQIRNEYSLADPELYRAADKDDPEALLEGVAMAGLVGVLRQLGDLAEFAAEIFHDLHEEVMVTAARGHSLMVRVQQLEVEFPTIEKAFLSQTNHSSFFYNSGLDWHPNVHMDQSLITRGDLPRFVMDSYEECRGPPRLFLLDKFDVAGAGACLKRYSDPSFFKVEPSSFGITSTDVQREKKARKAKKKGSRWRNGETPEVLPTSHAKLHQLFLEERIGNGTTGPTQRVKLKRRLNGFPFASKSGKSYMEKFLKSPSPDHKEVHEIPVDSSTYESAFRITTVSPEEEVHPRSISQPSSPAKEEIIPELFVDKLNEVPTATRDPVVLQSDRDLEAHNVSDSGLEAYNIPSTLQVEDSEKEIAVDGGSKTDDSVDDYQSEDIASEVDNYMDALTNTESEMDTDSEFKIKNELRYLNSRREASLDANEVQLQAHSSDSQSMGNSTLSDDGNSLSKKENSSSSYSDTHSSAENTPSDGEVASNVFPSTETHQTVVIDSSLHLQPTNEGRPQSQPPGSAVSDGVSTDTAKTPSYSSDLGDQTASSSPSDSDPSYRSTEAFTEAFTKESTLMVTETDKIVTNPSLDIPHISSISEAPEKKDYDSPQRFSESQLMFESEAGDKYTSEIVPVTSNLSVSSQFEDDFQHHALAENQLVDELNDEDVKPDKNVASVSNQDLNDDGPPKINDENPSLLSTDDQPLNELHGEDQNLSENVPLTSNLSDSPSQLGDGLPLTVSAESLPVKEIVDEYPNSIGGLSIMAAKNKSDESSVDSVPESGTNEDLHVPSADNNQIGEQNPVMPLTHAEPLGQTHYLDAEPGDRVSNIDDVSQSGEEIADNVIPKEDTPSKLVEQLVSETNAEVVSIRSSEEQTPCSREVYSDEPLDMGDGSEMSEAACNTTLLERDSTLEPSLLAGNHVNLDEIDTEHSVNAAATFAGPDNNATDDGEGSIGDIKTLRDVCLSGSEGEVEGFLTEEACLLERPGESGATESLRQQIFSLPGSDSGFGQVVDNDQSESESQLPNDVSGTYTLLEAKDNMDATIVTVIESSFKQNELESSHTEEKVESLTDQLDQQNVLEANSEVLTDLDQTQYGKYADHVGPFGDYSNPLPVNLPNEPSETELSLQGSNNIHISQHPVSPSSILYSFSLLPSVSQIYVDEVPPMPPLPPVQWRMTKFQHASPGQERAFMQNGASAFPPLFPSKADQDTALVNQLLPQSTLGDENSHPVVEEAVGKTVHFSPFISEVPSVVHHGDSEDNILPLESTDYTGTLQLSGSDGEILQNIFQDEERENEKSRLSSSSNLSPTDTASAYALGLSPEEFTQPLNQGASETNLDEKELVQSSTISDKNVVTSDTTILPSKTEVEQPEQAMPASAHAFGLSNKQLIRPLNEVAPETRTKEQELGNSSGHLEENLGASDNDPLSAKTENKQPQHPMSTSEVTLAWPVGEENKPNGLPPMKLARPRNPLIDAVAAHDKSKLRRVTERVRPQIQKEDERDSILEQIRTKSFNLKPAVVTRPSIPGPTTNLKVAAILEKAKTIRQAFAGSDEDDDDSWSDS